jgi:hypothetical protein
MKAGTAIPLATARCRYPSGPTVNFFTPMNVATVPATAAVNTLAQRARLFFMNHLSCQSCCWWSAVCAVSLP